MCDIDPQAVEFAKKNAELNGVDCVIEQADLLQGNIVADFIFANITADILMRFAPSIGNHLADGGEIVVSGIIAERLDEVRDCYEKCGYRVQDTMAIDDWRAMKLVRA